MKLDLDKLMKNVTTARATLDARSNKNNAIKPPQGKSRWRILPGWRVGDPETYHHPYAEHWIKDSAGKVLAVVVCERETFGRECDCCDRIADVGRVYKAAGYAKDSPQMKALGDLRPKVSQIVNALRRDGDTKSDTQPVLMAIGNGLHGDYLAITQTRAEEGITMLDLEAGKDVVIERMGSMLDTEYKLQDAGTTSSINEDVMKNLVNVDAWIEAKRQQGLPKANAIEGACRALLGGMSPGSTASLSISPPAASLAPPAALSRPKVSVIIDQDEAPVATQAAPAAVTPTAADKPAPLAATTVAAPAPAASSASSDLLSDDELAAMLGNL